jgi:ribosomal protein S27E
MEGDILAIKCPSCGNPFNVRREWLGRKAKCRACQRVFMISAPEGGRVPAGSDAQGAPLANGPRHGNRNDQEGSSGKKPKKRRL